MVAVTYDAIRVLSINKIVLGNVSLTVNCSFKEYEGNIEDVCDNDMQIKESLQHLVVKQGPPSAISLPSDVTPAINLPDRIQTTREGIWHMPIENL